MLRMCTCCFCRCCSCRCARRAATVSPRPPRRARRPAPEGKNICFGVFSKYSISLIKDHDKVGQSEREHYPINRLGCLAVLDSLYQNEVVPLIQPVYMFLSIIIAVVEIASVALAAAYINVLKNKDTI